MSEITFHSVAQIRRKDLTTDDEAKRPAIKLTIVNWAGQEDEIWIFGNIPGQPIAEVKETL